jgi:hypothetical protein
MQTESDEPAGEFILPVEIILLREAITKQANRILIFISGTGEAYPALQTGQARLYRNS